MDVTFTLDIDSDIIEKFLAKSLDSMQDTVYSDESKGLDSMYNIYSGQFSAFALVSTFKNCLCKRSLVFSNYF